MVVYKDKRGRKKEKEGRGFGRLPSFFFPHFSLVFSWLFNWGLDFCQNLVVFFVFWGFEMFRIFEISNQIYEVVIIYHFKLISWVWNFCHCLHYRRITSRVSDRIRCRKVSLKIISNSYIANNKCFESEPVLPDARIKYVCTIRVDNPNFLRHPYILYLIFSCKKNIFILIKKCFSFHKTELTISFQFLKWWENFFFEKPDFWHNNYLYYNL